MSGKYKNLKFALVAATLTMSANGFAQTVIKGTVTDNTGEPVIGASVLEQGTSSNGGVTDIDGNFTITLKGNSKKLKVSYVGMKPQVVNVSGKSVINIKLEDDATSLNDVVVIGYGSVKKKDLTGSVATVGSKALTEVPVASASEALTGKMAGVQVTTSEGSPDAEVKIRVRGGGSITQSNDPLYIVDGFPVDGIGDIPATDIEDITVLKDASSTAIYGSRGANGVILVTTKSGKSGKVNVSYNAYYSVKKIAKTMDLLTPYDYAKWQYELALLKNQKDITSYTDYFGNYQDMDMYKDVAANDWQDIVYGRTGHTFNHNLNINGGSETIKYAFSYAHMNDKAIQIGSNFKRDNFSLKLNTKPTKNTTLDFQVRYSDTDIRGGGANDATGSMDTDRRLKYALYYYPMPLSNLDESAGSDDDELGNLYNPVVSQYDNDRVKERKQLNFAGAFGWEIIKNLKAKVEFGYDDYNQYDQRYYGKTTYQARNSFSDYPGLPGITLEDTNRNKFRNTNTVSYDFKKLLKSKKHSLNMMVGHEYIITKKRTHSDEIHGFPSDFDSNTAWKLTGQGHPVKVNDIYSADDKLLSFFTRANYNYEDKYLLSFTFRADASSKFSKDNRWGYFPSASAAWRISDEQFFKNVKKLSFINDMKIRASYGVTGNFQIGDYDHLATMSIDNYILGNGLAYGYKPDNIKRDDLSWEKNQMINAGIDLQMFDGYLGLSVDYYNTNTSNMLLYVPVPLLTGYSTSLQNLGKVNNRGWEIGLTSQHTFANGLGYSFNVNYAKNTNEVKELGPGNAPIISSGSVGHAYYITEVGKPIGSYYLLKYDGVFKNQQELDSYPHLANAKVGDFRFVDVDGSGDIDLDKDRTVCGNYMPKFTYGFGGKLWYGGFDMDFNFQGVYGNKILNLNRRYIDNMEGNVNGTKVALDRWKSPENPGSGWVNRANRKQTGSNGRTSTWHLEGGSYLRLQNLALGYTLPRAFTQKFKVEKMRVYVSGQNLFTITDYSGYNPEVNARPSQNLTPGEDYGTYPLARTYMFGLNITL